MTLFETFYQRTKQQTEQINHVTLLHSHNSFSLVCFVDAFPALQTFFSRVMQVTISILLVTKPLIKSKEQT